MKKYRNLLLVIIGLVLFLGILALMLFSVVDFEWLWVKYVMLFAGLLFFIGLSKIFKKVTDINESQICLIGAMKNIQKLCNTQKSKKREFVVMASIKNQLKNACIYLNAVIDEYDLYSLKDNIKNIEKIEKNNYDDFRISRTEEEMKNDIKIIQDTLKEIERIQKIYPSVV